MFLWLLIKIILIKYCGHCHSHYLNQCLYARRVPGRKDPPRCRRGSNCPVDGSMPIQCPGCRFAKCLRNDKCVDQAHLPLHIFIAFSSSVGMQLTQVLTPSQCKERFLSVHRRRQEQVGRVFFFSLRLLLIFSQAQVATDRFLSDHRRRQEQVG